jgi:transcriptional regulator with XRE-family HTH domain
MERKEIGTWLRQQREARCWSRPEMARQLIRAAYAVNDRSMVDVDNLCHNIYRWERGTVSPSERYRLYYCQAFSIPHAAFGSTETAKTSALVLPHGFSGEVGKLLNLLDVEHGVSLRAESSAIAVRIARELSEGMTQAGRIATHEFLTEIAQAVRWPRHRGFTVSSEQG